LPSGLKVLAKRLFDDDAVDTILGDMALFPEIFSDRNEDAWWKGKVEYTIALLGLVLVLDVFEVFVEFNKGFAVLVPARNVRRQILELLNGFSDTGIVVGVLDVGCLAPVELFLIHLRPGIPNDFDAAGEETLAIETKKGGESLKHGFQFQIPVE
jgi:hypothetical protein